MAQLKKKTKTIIIAISIILVFLAVAFTVLFFPIKPSYYSIETHAKNISERVEKRYFASDTEFTDYKIYPIYNEKDELEYFLIELESVGFVYVHLNTVRLGFHILGAYGMYSYGAQTIHIGGVNYINGVIVEAGWTHYKVANDNFLSDEHWLQEENNPNHYVEVDSQNNPIVYNVSPYKVADVLQEKLYMLKVKIADTRSDSIYIPAVKRGDKFFNLISMEEFVFESEAEEDSVAGIHLNYVPKNEFDL